MVQKVFARASILLHDMGNQPEVAFDKDITCFQVALGAKGKVMPFFFLGQRFGEAAGLQLQRIKQAA